MKARIQEQHLDFNFIEFILVYLFPVVIGQVLILSFGCYYNLHPGDGYGWGLLASIALNLGIFAFFIWHHWNDKEE